MDYGTIANMQRVHEYGPYPDCFMDAAKALIPPIDSVLKRFSPDIIVIEETNSSKARYSQKMLEWIHYAVVELLRKKLDHKVIYINSSGWRKTLQVGLSKEDKKKNSKLATAKRKAAKNGVKLDRKALGIKGRVTKKHVAIRWANEQYGLALKVKDDDVADAICLGCSYFAGVPHCDGK